MSRKPPFTFSDAEVTAREVARHPFVARASAWRRDRMLRVYLDLTASASREYGVPEDGKVWVDLAVRPPRLATRCVGEEQALAGQLADAVERARRLIGRGTDRHPSLGEAYAMAGLSPGCGIDAVRRWGEGALAAEASTTWLVRVSAAVSDLCIAEGRAG